jgi:large subunit ribosomal protein L13
VRTYVLKQKEVDKDWLVIDASGIPLGRLASRIAGLLRGKHKPTFTPSMDMGDNVIVLNAREVRLTGEKLQKKSYQRFSGYLGGQRTIPLRTLMAVRPERVITIAVRGMLPKTRLGRQQLRHLRVYAGGEHPHAAQQPRPVVMD